MFQTATALRDRQHRSSSTRNEYYVTNSEMTQMSYPRKVIAKLKVGTMAWEADFRQEYFGFVFDYSEGFTRSGKGLWAAWPILVKVYSLSFMGFIMYCNRGIQEVLFICCTVPLSTIYSYSMISSGIYIFSHFFKISNTYRCSPWFNPFYCEKEIEFEQRRHFSKIPTWRNLKNFSLVSLPATLLYLPS